MFLEEDDVEALRMADPARREDNYVIMDSKPDANNLSGLTPAPQHFVESKQNNAALTEIVRFYEDAKSLIAEKDATIQTLSYKLGKIESELANSVPVLEYKKTTFLLESAKSKSDTDADILSNKIAILETEVNKRNSAIITLVILFMLVLGFSVIFILFGGVLK